MPTPPSTGRLPAGAARDHRRLFRKLTGITPRDHRRNFQPPRGIAAHGTARRKAS